MQEECLAIRPFSELVDPRAKKKRVKNVFGHFFGFRQLKSGKLGFFLACSPAVASGIREPRVAYNLVHRFFCLLFFNMGGCRWKWLGRRYGLLRGKTT